MNIRFHLGEKGLYRMVNAAFLVCIGLFAAGRYLGVAAPDWRHVLTGILFVLLLTGFNYLSARGRILCALVVAGCLGATAAVAGFESAVNFFLSYVRWLLNRPLWHEEWLRGYQVIQILFLSLICYLLQMLLEKDFWIKQAGSIILLAVLLYCFCTKKELSHEGAALIICYLVMAMLEWTQIYWKKVKSRSGQAYMLWMSPFLLVYLVLLLRMPAPQDPYDWQLFKDIYHRINESFQTFTQNLFHGGGEDYDLSLSGFAESGSLSPGFLENEREIMKLESDKDLKTNVYLIGKVYDTFDGNGWQQLNEDTSKERYIDTVETLYAVQRYDKAYQRDYIKSTDLKIQYRNLKSAYLFAPLKTWSVEEQNQSLDFVGQGGSLMFDEKKGYGTEYETVYYQLNLGQELFDEFLEAPKEPDEKLLRQIFVKAGSDTGEKLTEADLENHRLRIYDLYTEDISLSPEVAAYVARITQNAETDVEKLRAIETELSSYTYTRTPGELPDTVTDSSSFLDYFLLESRQGYCSYFATAFTLLARAEGIPARYVQGYCVTMGANEEKIVTSDMAHAWPEIYIEDVGWIPFEPTPGYSGRRYKPWKLWLRESSRSDGSGYWLEEQDGDKSQRPEEEADEDTAEVEELEKTGWESSAGKFIRIMLLTFSVVVTFGLLALLFEHLIGRYRYQKMNENQKYMVEIHSNLRILARIGLERKEGETLEELQCRMNTGLEPEKFSFVEDYEEFLYGDRCADQEMLQLAKEEQDRLLELLRQKRRWTYLYYIIFANRYRM